MASKEGFRRITKLGRGVATTGALLLLLGFLIRLWESMRPSQGYSSAGVFMVPGAYLTVVGWLVLAVGWIGAGFSMSGDSDEGSA
jgi:hypothetical protein